MDAGPHPTNQKPTEFLTMVISCFDYWNVLTVAPMCVDETTSDGPVFKQPKQACATPLLIEIH